MFWKKAVFVEIKACLWHFGWNGVKLVKRVGME